MTIPTDEFEKKREWMMENEADDLPFKQPRLRARNWVVLAVVAAATLATPLFYIALSMFGGMIGDRGVLFAILVIVFSSFLTLAVFVYALRFFMNNSRQAKPLLVQHLMTERPASCDSLDSISDCARAMYHQNVGFMVVSNAENKCIGVVTDRDMVCGGLAQGLEPQTTPVTLVMERDFKSVGLNATVDQILRAMSEAGARRLPVMSGSECVGVVSIDDLITKRACTIDDIAAVLERQLAEPHHLPAAEADVA